MEKLGLDDIPLRLDVLLEPRSLVVFTGLLYSHYVHEVPEATEDVVDPDYCVNYDVVAPQLEDWEGEGDGGDSRSVAGSTSVGVDVDPSSTPPGRRMRKKKISHRGNLRTSVTYRRVWNVV
jgi:hypothetical protein